MEYQMENGDICEWNEIDSWDFDYVEYSIYDRAGYFNETTGDEYACTSNIFLNGSLESDSTEDGYEWDDDYTILFYEDPNEFDIFNLDLSTSEALAAISKLEGEAWVCEEIVKDLEYFDIYGDCMEYGKLAYEYKTFLALTIVDMDGVDSYANQYEENYKIDSEMLYVNFKVSKTLLEDTLEREFSYISWYLILPAEKGRPSERHLSWMLKGDGGVLYNKVWPHPNCIDWGGFNGPGSL